MPMIEAAPRAALYASADRVSAASSAISRSVVAERVAAAVASRVPHSCCSLSTVVRASEERLSFRSLAYSGSEFFRVSMLTALPRLSDARRQQFAGVDGGIALLPVAGAQFVGLQRVQHPQHLVDITAHGTGGHRDELDLVVRVDDEGGAVGHTVGIENAGRGGEFTLEIRQHRERQG